MHRSLKEKKKQLKPAFAVGKTNQQQQNTNTKQFSQPARGTVKSLSVEIRHYKSGVVDPFTGFERSSCCSASPRPAAAPAVGQDPTSLCSLILTLILAWRAAAPVPCSKFSTSCWHIPGTSLFNFPASTHMARFLP